jgi:hypothetical protein
MWVKVFSRCGLIGVFKSNKYMPSQTQLNSNCSCKKETNLPEVEANLNVEVYPNPTNDNWQVLLHDFSNIKYADLKLFDLNGKQVWYNYVSEFHYSNVTVPAANLPKGIYLLKVVTDRQTHSIKLIKN